MTKSKNKTKRYWLVKQEPEDYSWDDLVRDGITQWTGVRNFQARNNLRQMQVGDAVFFYHSGKEKSIVAIAQVAKTAYPDPTAGDPARTPAHTTPATPLPPPAQPAPLTPHPHLPHLLLIPPH